jgi:hypothetical protein
VLIFSISGIAQQQNLPLNREFGLVNQKSFNSYSSNTHTSILPINESLIRLNTSKTFGGLSKVEQAYYLINISKSEKKPKNFLGWLYRTAFYENFAIVDTGNLYLTVDPLLNGEFGKDNEDNSGDILYKNTRGIIVRANVGEKFSFQTSFYENQATLPNYMSGFVSNTGVVPGQGRVKTFKENGYDFSASSANISYTPFSFINLQLGTGKNFIGDGYRSLLLSDQAFNYPYFKISSLFGKKEQFQYVQINTQLTNLTRREDGSVPEALFLRKAMSTHYLSWNVTKWLNLGFFENTIWQTEDSSGTKPFQFQQLNPVIGINALTTITDKANHSNVGINTKIKFPFKFIVYNQFIYDGNQYEKTKGFQVGAKYFGLNYFTFQVEYNKMSNPYSTIFEPQLQQFSHYNESLTHPLGNNFEEIVGILNFKYKRAFAQVKINYATLTNTTITTTQAHLGYLINPKNNLSVVFGFSKRNETRDNLAPYLTNYMYFGIRTSLRNLYDDF